MVPGSVPSIAAIQTSAPRPPANRCRRERAGVVAGAAMQALFRSVPVRWSSWRSLAGLDRHKVSPAASPPSPCRPSNDGHGGRRFPVKGITPPPAPPSRRSAPSPPDKGVVAVIARQHIVAGAAEERVTADAPITNRLVPMIRSSPVIPTARWPPGSRQSRCRRDRHNADCRSVCRRVARTKEILDRLCRIRRHCRKPHLGRVLDIVDMMVLLWSSSVGNTGEPPSSPSS